MEIERINSKEWKVKKGDKIKYISDTYVDNLRIAIDWAVENLGQFSKEDLYVCIIDQLDLPVRANQLEQQHYFDDIFTLPLQILFHECDGLGAV